MSQRFEGRNLDDALNVAAQALGAERWQLTYHVLLEKRGFLGGTKRVVIEAEVNETATAPAAAQPATAAVSDAGAPPRRERGGRGGRGGGGGGGGRDRDRGRGGRGRRGGNRRESADDLQSGDFERFLGDVPEQGPESESATQVREWVDRVLRLGRFDLVARTEENDTQIIVRLHGADAKRTIERHGELLDAIQVLANKALGGRKIEKDIELDCEGFKSHRAEDLAARAKEMADRVRSERVEQLLPAMTPIERRLVHLALRDDPEVTTESRGEGFYKRVAIILRTEAPAAEPQTESQPEP
jgi:predicted RNA-binding protein Jag